MTYIRDGAEYLDYDERKVYDAIKYLTSIKRSGNNSQISNVTYISRTRVGEITTYLRQRGFIKDVAKGNAYHWRVTGQPVPYPVEARERDRELAARQRELNARPAPDPRDGHAAVVSTAAGKCDRCGCYADHHQS